MKKIIAIMALIAFGATFAFARTSRASRSGDSGSARSSGGDGERSIHVVGFDVPIWNQSWYDGDADEDDYFSAAGFNFMYHHLSVADNRFSSFLDVELGYTSWSFDEYERNGQTVTVTNDAWDGMSGFNTRYMFGLGGAPLSTDRVVLAVHGTFGVALSYGSNSYSYTGYAYDDYNNKVIANYDYDTYLFNFWTTIGANVEAAVNITGNFGVFAGINMHINLLGWGICGYDKTISASGYNASKTNDSLFGVIYPGNFNIDFRLGVAFMY